MNRAGLATSAVDSGIANEIIANHNLASIKTTPPTNEEIEALENIKYSVIDDVKSGQIKNMGMMFDAIDTSSLHSEHINKLLEEIMKLADEGEVDVASLFDH